MKLKTKDIWHKENILNIVTYLSIWQNGSLIDTSTKMWTIVCNLKILVQLLASLLTLLVDQLPTPAFLWLANLNQELKECKTIDNPNNQQMCKYTQF